MLALRYNTLSVQDLFHVESTMRKIVNRELPFDSMDYTVLDKSRAEIYGILVGLAERQELCSVLGISPSDFLDFVIDVDNGYLPNPYHSFYHAADVAIVLHLLLFNYGVSQHLTKTDMAALYIAGLCHDIGHPGLNNNFQVNLKTELARRYRNKSVLESYSCTLTMDLFSKHGLLRNVEQASTKGVYSVTEEQFRISVVKMILATDMVFHYELQENLEGLLEIIVNSEENDHRCDGRCQKTIEEEEEEYEINSSRYLTANANNESGQVKDIFQGKGSNSPLRNFEEESYLDQKDKDDPHEPSLLLDHQERQMLCQIVLHAADISNALRPWPICRTWSDLVCEEFFRQGEVEKMHGLPVSPNMDRSQVSQNTIGLQFGDFVVSPYFEIFAALYPKVDELLKQLATNRTEWLKCEEEEKKRMAERETKVPTTTPEKEAELAQREEQEPDENRGRLPLDMLPDEAILNPAGRRFSVAAGMVVIPDELEERVIGSGKSRRKYLGLRSISDTGINEKQRLESPSKSIPPSPPLSNDVEENGGKKKRRKSEEPGYFLYRHQLKIRDGRHLTRADMVDKCLERQSHVASPR